MNSLPRRNKMFGKNRRRHLLRRRLGALALLVVLVAGAAYVAMGASCSGPDFRLASASRTSGTRAPRSS